MTQPTLFHGTNSNDIIYYEKRKKTLVRLLSRKWTTHPGEAMNFAFSMARKFNGEMVVIVLPEWDPRYFHDLGERLAVTRRDLCHWYKTQNTYRQESNSTEQRSVRVYTQNQLEDFVQTYCTDIRRENMFLQAYLSKLKE